MRFSNLGSGSSGNATLVEAGDPARPTRLLVDCGFSLRELTRRLALRGVEPGQIDAVFVTHEHGDHVGCALTLARRHGVRLCMSAGTWSALRQDSAPASLHLLACGDTLDVGALQLQPFAVPHDAREPLQLRVHDGQHHLGLLTDLGEVTDAVAQALAGCDALLLEANHDREMLLAGPYPWVLKRRISGRFGHLENGLAAALLQRLHHAGLRHVVAAHLSRQNNSPALAAQALAAALGTGAQDIVVADPALGCDWLDLH
ncbi:MBL fold metallo-hydrolase [Azohydromonas australica]|uniref:MBL fold metallo-hydrolase n=1 Tax=Azohydromonas australica TaxID=364039 RepID=UPI00068595F8|nr:MBL fold metallo-hydrolase [Azohydromonas australica]